MREIIEVPFLRHQSTPTTYHPLAFSKVLISFLILHISTFFSSGVILLKSYPLATTTPIVLRAWLFSTLYDLRIALP